MLRIIKSTRSLKFYVVQKRYNHVEHKVKVNDLNINVVQSGKGENNVLLMPGALGSGWSDFKPQIENLPKLLPNYCIIAWDPPGYGKSIPPKRYFGLDFFHTDASHAVALMKVLNKPHFSILGWSDGGITGLIAAAHYKENVEKLIIWGSNSYINDEECKIYNSIRDVKSWSLRMREPMEKMYGPERFAELWGEWIDAIITIYEKRNGDICKTEVDQIQVPTLIMHGKKDPMIASEHVPYLMKHIKGVKYYEFPEGKHNIHLRYPEEFNKIVANFLLDNL